MEIVGLDLGYTYTKTDKGIIFPSRVSLTAPLVNGKKIVLNDAAYYIGEGMDTIEVNKINNVITKICMLYAICKTTQDNEIRLVTGLPIAQYETQHRQLKDMILSNRRYSVIVNDIGRTFNINDCKIYPQAAGALFAAGIADDAIVIDIGGRTVDIAYFTVDGGTQKIVKSCTLYEGMLPLYTKIIAEVNKRYNLTLDAEYAEKILRNGLSIMGHEQDISFIKPILAEHTEIILRELTLNYPYQTVKIYLCGGGALLLYPIIFKHLTHAQIINNSQFANAIGFRKVGESIWRS